MTALAALAFAYGVVGIVLVTYVMRLVRRLQRMDAANRRADASARAVPDR